MKMFFILLSTGIILFASCTPEKNHSNLSALEEFSDSLFQVNVDSSKIAGAAIIAFHKGKTILDKSYGFASLELSTPMPQNAIFEIGSVTKQFTAAAILKLSEEGKLSLSDDFTKYLDFDAQGRMITIDNLLNHTSGISSYTEIHEFWDLSIEHHPRDTLVRIVEQKDFLFEPGEALIYNNSAYFFLGLIIEKVSEKSYDEYLKEVIFEPLGMSNTHYSSNSEVIPNKVYGYSYSRDGLKQKPYLDHTWPYSAGSLCSTTEDILIWMKALHEGKILNDRLYELLITPEQLKDGTKVRYARGLVNYTTSGNHVIGHGGGIHGFLSETRYFPDEDLYLICLVNTTGPAGAQFFVDQLTWKLLEKQEQQAVDIDIDLEAISGKYTGQVRGAMLSIEVEIQSNELIISRNEQHGTDTLRTYVGNNTWIEGDNIYTTLNDSFRIDDIYGNYLLLRE